MRQRKSTENTAKPIIITRRSPRFLQQNQTDQEYTKTPDPVPEKIRVPFSDLTPLSSRSDGDSLKRCQLSDKANETSVRCRNSVKVSTGPRRSTRLNGGADSSRHVGRSHRVSQNDNVDRILSGKCKLDGSSNAGEIGKRLQMNRISASEKRVTRSSIKGCNNEGVSGSGKGCDSKCISDEGKVIRGVSLSEQCTYKIQKSVTRSASRGIKDEHNKRIGNVEGSEAIQKVPFGCSDKKGFSGDGKDKLGANLPREPITDVPSADLVGGEHRRDGVEAAKNQVGAKRKKDQVEEEHTMFQGWTAEQELALERAYFAAKPTPHFWKKVAKMVPGKSAQECFTKIHSELLTPAQQQPRSRAKGMNASLSLSANKLLNASEPETKKLRYGKQKRNLTRRTVRQLLQKQYNTDHDYEADLFDVLESRLDPFTQLAHENRLSSTPELNREGPGFDKRCLEVSSSAHIKLLSQSNDSCGATVISPPVLKKIKNKALHEKYIDQLHSREARRQAASLRARKCMKEKSGDKEDNLQKSQALKAAKNALLFCARDAVKQFHHLESSKMNKFDDTFHDFTDTSEDEIEDE
ncbi:hypothetical protein ACH5RR_013915 [Cinchona calisaya]|uniref:Myb-like domain-containing protein n=1 Tax=Cinchona calisaya TaxID=153742 RepID=A0ABD3A780_9GENT